MSPLRRLPTARIVLVCVLVVTVGASAAAITLAASGGPVPPRRPLAQAVHRALVAPAPSGIFARITLTNGLLGGLGGGGRDGEGGGGPLVNGGSGRLWIDRAGRVRLEVQGDNGDVEAVLAGRHAWLYDPSSNTAYTATLPAGGSHAGTKQGGDRVPTLTAIRGALRNVTAHARVNGPAPGDTAGQPSYTVRVRPRGSGGMIGGAALTWDAVRGVPLDVSIYARGNASPVLELSVSDIQYGPVDPGVFRISPPATAHRVALDSGSGSTGAAKTTHPARKTAPVTGLHAVSARLPFRLAAPAALAGRHRSEVSLAGRSTALVRYGQGLGAILVLEQPADRGQAAPGPGKPAGGRGPSLPTVQIGGAPASELPTPLGTLVRFTRGGVTYTVVGSVPRARAEAAARGL